MKKHLATIAILLFIAATASATTTVENVWTTDEVLTKTQMDTLVGGTTAGPEDQATTHAASVSTSGDLGLCIQEDVNSGGTATVFAYLASGSDTWTTVLVNDVVSGACMIHWLEDNRWIILEDDVGDCDVYETTDNGDTWNLVGSTAKDCSGSSRFTFRAHGPDEWSYWLAGDQRPIYTEDGGGNWTVWANDCILEGFDNGPGIRISGNRSEVIQVGGNNPKIQHKLSLDQCATVDSQTDLEPSTTSTTSGNLYACGNVLTQAALRTTLDAWYITNLGSSFTNGKSVQEGDASAGDRFHCGIGYCSILHTDSLAAYDFQFRLTYSDNGCNENANWFSDEVAFLDAEGVNQIPQSFVSITGEAFILWAVDATDDTLRVSRSGEPPEPFVEASEFDEGIKDFATNIGFKTSGSQFFFGIGLMFAAIISTAALFKETSMRTMTIIASSVGFIVAFFNVYQGWWDLWAGILIFILAGTIVFLAVRGVPTLPQIRRT